MSERGGLSGASRPPASEGAFLGSPDAVVTKPVHLLVVDDEPAIASCLAETLAAAGFTVSMAGNGAEAMAQLARQPVQMIVTDLKLPDADGITLLSRARQMDSRIQGVVMTGYGTVDVAIQAMKSGAADLLVKPFEPEQVVLTVKRVLELHRLRNENGLLKQTMLRAGGVRLADFQLEHLHEGAPTTSRSSPNGDPAVVEAAFQRGMVEGERRAAERSVQALGRQHEVLAAAAREFDRARTALVAGAADHLADLAVAIAAKLVHGAYEQSRDVVITEVRDALSRVSSSPSVLIRVHPEDVTILEGARAQLNEGFEKPITLKIEADASVSRGGCRLEAPTCFVDATLEAKLARIAEAIKGNTA